MQQVPGFKLWLGNTYAVGRNTAFDQAQVAALIYLSKEGYPIRPRRELIHHRFPLVDTSGNSPELLRQAIDTVAGLVRDGVPTLICCTSGFSRSAAIAAAAIAQLQNKDATQTLGGICAALSVDVSWPLWMEIHSAIHSEGDPILMTPPKTAGKASKKVAPTEEYRLLSE